MRGSRRKIAWGPGTGPPLQSVWIEQTLEKNIFLHISFRPVLPPCLGCPSGRVRPPPMSTQGWGFPSFFFARSKSGSYCGEHITAHFHEHPRRANLFLLCALSTLHVVRQPACATFEQVSCSTICCNLPKSRLWWCPCPVSGIILLWSAISYTLCFPWCLVRGLG